MAKSKLSQNNAMFSLRQVIYRKLSYPLLTTTFSATQCQAIMSPILGCGLPAAGVVRSFPHALAHGPLTYDGLDLPNLHMEQTITHIMQVLSSSTSDNTTAFLLCTCGEYMRLEVGLTGELFQIPSLLCDLITDSWIKHMWQTLLNLNIILHSGFPDITSPCHGNIKLMRLFLTHGFQTANELSILNQCQVYLHAFWLSDICNGLGECIEAHVWTHLQPVHSPWIWPQAITPSTGDWRVWQSALSKCLNLSKNLYLNHSLGHWKPISIPSGWFFKQKSDRLWLVQDSRWFLHGFVPSHMRTKISSQAVPGP